MMQIKLSDHAGVSCAVPFQLGGELVDMGPPRNAGDDLLRQSAI